MALTLHCTYTLKSKSIQYNNALFYIYCTVQDSVFVRSENNRKLLNKHHTKLAASQTIFLKHNSHQVNTFVI